MEKKTHILMIDDDKDILRIICGYLVREGYEVLSAHDGNEGREIARRLQPELILLDINMPVMDGYKTLEYLKHDKETAHIPVIFLTNEDLSIESENAWKVLGIAGYIPKSETREFMLSTIQKAIGGTPPTPSIETP